MSKYSRKFLAGVEHYEGFFPKRYKDPVGKWTIDIGKIEEQNKGIAALKTDRYLRDQVDQIHTEKQEFLGGQLDAANKLLGKIQATSCGTGAYPDDVYNALRMIEQGRP